MTTYRMKHLPTGLYFCPSREIKVKLKNCPSYQQYVKSNLSKSGKVYLKKPTFRFIGKEIYDHTLVTEPCKYRLRPFKESEWLIEEV